MARFQLDIEPAEFPGAIATGGGAEESAAEFAQRRSPVARGSFSRRAGLPFPRRRAMRRPLRRWRRPPLDLGAAPLDDRAVLGSEYVRWVQSSLNQLLGLDLAVDGIMTVQGRAAIRRFQARQRLPVDGIAGPETKQALIAARRARPRAPR